MQSTRRVAIPLRVHQIWDAIGRFGGTQVMDFEKLVEVVTSMHKVPRDELHHELDHAIKDGLVTSEVVETQKREETEIYRLPDHAKLDRGDHDWYCFQCHMGGPIVKCEDCPRVFHMDCLPDDRKPDKDLFVCPQCHIIATKPSAEKVPLKPKPLNQLIEYICERFQTWNAEWMEKFDGAKWAAACNRSEKDAWRLNVLVHRPMDLATMQDKATSAKYQSLEEFQVDCETLVHAIGVYFGVESLKGNQFGAAFLKEAMHDIQEIKLCHQCFRRSNEKDHDWWFALPCTPPHDVVWAKQTGYPFWPAKVMKREGNRYDVRYFGGNYERGHIDAKHILPIETSLAKLKVRRTAGWNDAYEEMQKFQEIAKNPTLVNSLPPRGKNAGSAAATTTAVVNKKGGSKRAASTPTEEPTITKRTRKSEPIPATVTTPSTKATSKKVPASAKAAVKTKGKESPAKTNGTSAAAATAPSQIAKRKSTNTTSNAKSGAAPSRRESTTNATTPASKRGGSATKFTPAAYDISTDESLDPDLRSILTEPEDEESLGGDVSFSDEESSEPTVSEDVVSSSCNEGSATRNAYVQVSRPGTTEVNVERLVGYINQLKEQNKNEIELNKKKQWCFNCGREAIYHCCWNTAYCSIECQQQHWGSEHKKNCRRKKI
ncbi:Zinc finger MYND domain-containing protein 11 [Folsomia candida]|uniref:Zinc finger MYND domain-containing protein 11 n=1 Tax=Folsomia candida TaxID=158441 RepID=A0A226EJ98_FOLCA|nr:Zinc finger MYND domain-containing protein 11 [Folsomia candida]